MPFKQAHDSSLADPPSLPINHSLLPVCVHETSRGTNIGFIGLNFFSAPTDFPVTDALHRKTYSVEHEPCGLLGDAESACDFVRANPILAVRNHPDSSEPLVERKRGILKDSPDLDGELPLGMFGFALPHATSRNESHVFASASRALDTIGPAALNEEVEAIVGISEVNDGLLESFWFGWHRVLDA